jgi:hypothetical protein
MSVFELAKSLTEKQANNVVGYWDANGMTEKETNYSIYRLAYES